MMNLRRLARSFLKTSFACLAASSVCANEWHKADTPQDFDFSHLHFNFGQFHTLSEGQVFSKGSKLEPWRRRRLTGTGGATSLQFTNSKLFALGEQGHLSVSEDGDSWRMLQVPVDEDTAFYNLAWGDGNYVLTGNNGIALRSPDLVQWDQVETPIAGAITSVSYFNSEFYIWGTEPPFFRRGFRSSDLLTWTPSLDNLGNSGVVENEIFAWDTFNLSSSSDGISWVESEIPRIQGNTGFAQYPPVATPFGLFFPGNEAIYVQNTPTKWDYALTGTLPISGLAWTGSELVAMHSNGKFSTTTDGLTWAVSGTTSAEATDIASNGTRVVVVHQNGGITSSTDGLTWTTPISGTEYDLTQVKWAGSFWIIIGDNGTLLTSSDGTSWTNNSPIKSDEFHYTACFYNGTQAVVYASNGAVLTSDNGTDWTIVQPGVLDQIEWIGGRFIGFSGRTAFTTEDGLSWQADKVIQGGFNSPVRELHFTGSRYFTSAGPHTSEDGLTWTLVTGTTHGGDGLAGDSSELILVSFSNSKVSYSSDHGETWAESNLNPASYNFNSRASTVVWNGSSFLVAGGPNHFTSDDGSTWTRHDDSPIEDGGVIADGSRFLGWKGQVIFESADGTTWSTLSSVPGSFSSGTTIGEIEKIGARYFATAIERFTNTSHLYASQDGITWTDITGANPGDPFPNLDTLVGNDQLLLGMSGHDGVYQLADGDNTLSKANLASSFPDQIQFSVSPNGGLFFMRGPNTVYWSDNALTWNSLSGFSDVPKPGKNTIYDGNQYLSVGGFQSILTSQDGITWTSTPISGVSEALNLNLIHHDGINYYSYAGTGATAKIYRSSNGLTWAESASFSPRDIEPAGFATLGTQVVLAGRGHTSSFDSGMGWTAAPAQTHRANSLVSLASSGTRIVSVGDFGMILWSDDGQVWQSVEHDFTSLSFTSIVWADDRFIAFAADQAISSLDGQNWDFLGNLPFDVHKSSWSGEVLLAASEGDASNSLNSVQSSTSTDKGLTWNLPITHSNTVFSSLTTAAWNNGIFLLGGSPSFLMRSSDGENWTETPSSALGEMTEVVDIEASPAGFIILGRDGRSHYIGTSIDGQVWTNQYQRSSDDPLKSVAASLDRGFGVGQSIQFERLEDETWIRSDFPTEFQLPSPSFNEILWTGNQFIAVGERHEIYTFPSENLSSSQYLDWAQASNLPESDNAPDQDPDRDSVTNLMEMALGTNPLLFDSATPDLQIFENAGKTDFSFTRSAGGTANIAYSVEFSSDMTNWNTSNDFPRSFSASPAGAGLEKFTISITEPDSRLPSARYMRLRVTLTR